MNIDILCRRGVITTLLMLLVSFSFFSQKNEEIYTPMIFLEKGMEANENEDYEKAISYFDKIHSNDTLYNEALLQLVINHRQLKNYKKAILICDEGIDLKNDYVRQFYLNKAVAFDSLGLRDKVFSTMTESNEKFPMDHWQHIYLYYIHSGHGNFDKALQSLKDGIANNPLEPVLHALLGLEAAKAGQLTRSILPLTFACLLSPEGTSTNSWLVSANTVSSEDMKATLSGINWDIDGEKFEELDLLIKNYVAIRSDYKVNSKLQFALIKQLHLIMDQMDPEQKGFWTSTYYPLLKKIKEENRFNSFTYLLSYTSNSKDHKRVFERKIDEIKEFNTWMLNELHEQFRKRPAPSFISGIDSAYCWYTDSKLTAMSDFNTKTNSLTGPYIHFGKNGHIDVNGQLDGDGGATGFWKYFDENGRVFRTSHYLKNELDGETAFFRDNGEMSMHRIYSNGKIHGLSKRYKVIGHLYETIEYVNDHKDGEQIGYFANGNLNYKMKNVDNKLNGKYTYYFQNGDIRIESTFKNEEIDGLYIKNHENGKLFQKYEAKEGKLSGEYVEYYNNGQLTKQGRYVNDNQAGKWKHYDRLGTLIEEEEFDEKGKLTGTSKNYDINGRLHIEYEYIKENLEVIRSYDTLGNIIKESKERRGKLPFTVLFPNGNTMTEGVFIKNIKEEEWKRYNYYGKLISKENYSGGKLNGANIEYYTNGNKRSITNFKEGEIDSIYLAYYDDGSLRYQANYSSGDIDGRLQEYSEKGMKVRDEYYLVGDLHGWQEYYTEEGKLYLKKKMDHGYPIRIIWFNENQDTLGDSRIENGEGVDKMYFSNGTLGRERHYEGGELNGPYRKYYPNGQVRYEREEVNDKTEGIYTSYYENGQVSFQGEYFNDVRIGPFKSFDFEGRLKSITNYDYGKKHGQLIEYNNDKEIIQISHYRLGELHGKKMYYSWKGDLQLILYYDNGILVAYSGPKELEEGNSRVLIPEGNAVIQVNFGNGSPSFICELRDGSFFGERKSYYPNGKLHNESVFLDGWYHGANISYYSNGTIRSRENYHYGNLDGVCKYYFPNGRLRYLVTYCNGDREGVAERYDESGSLISKQVYFADTMKEIK